jgi:hypothetical protein
LADHGIGAERLIVARLGLDILRQEIQALLDRREREHREPFEVQRFGDVLEAVVEVADDVIVGDPDVVEEDIVGAFVTHSPDGPDGDAGMIERHEEQRDAGVLRRLRIGAGPDPVPLGEMGRSGPRLLAVEPPAITVTGNFMAAASEPASGSL